MKSDSLLQIRAKPTSLKITAYDWGEGTSPSKTEKIADRERKVVSFIVNAYVKATLKKGYV